MHHERILSAFKLLGYTQTSVLQSYQANTALDRLKSSKGEPVEFDRDVAQQLWQNTPKHKGNTVLLSQYIVTIEQALTLLEQHIKTGAQKLRIERDPAYREDIQADLHSFANDHKTLSDTFNLPIVNISQIIHQSCPHAVVSQKMIALYGDVREFMWARTTPIFGSVPIQREQSLSLKIVLISTLVLLCIELFVMFHKNHFFNLLICVLILLIYVQNYFDRLYMRITLIAIALAIVLDFMWLSVLSEDWWNPFGASQHSRVQIGYLRFSYLMVIVSAMIKMFVLALMFNTLNNEQTLRKSVTIFDFVFKLDGMNQDNPFVHAIKEAVHPTAISEGQEQVQEVVINQQVQHHEGLVEQIETPKQQIQIPKMEQHQPPYDFHRPLASKQSIQPYYTPIGQHQQI